MATQLVFTFFFLFFFFNNLLGVFFFLNPSKKLIKKTFLPFYRTEGKYCQFLVVFKETSTQILAWEDIINWLVV